jgi:tetratricopeptide (TPR) repeat protein
MSVKVASNRFIVSSKSVALYQHIFSRVSDFQKLGDRLIQEANMAQSFRQIDKMEELGTVLCNIPFKEYKLIGHYYMGLAGCLKGERPQKLLEEVVEQSHTYKAKALISLAVIDAQQGDYESEYKRFIEALKYSTNPTTTVEALRAMAVVKAKEGFNKQSLRDLEQILPLARYGGTRAYHDYLNSYAVELGEAGRIEEAQNVCQITLASPFAFAYPEWRETGQDLALRGYKSRSSVSVKEIPGNLLYMPEREPSDTSIQSKLLGPAPVRSLEKWKEDKMVKEPNGNEELPEDMSVQEIAMKILEVITENKEDEIRLRKVLDYALDLFSKKK